MKKVKKFGVVKFVIVSHFLMFSSSIIMAQESADGFATVKGTTTGGAGGTTVTASNAANLKTYVENSSTPYIIQISGIIDLGGASLNVGSNKTIIGLDINSGTKNGRFVLSGGNRNIIIRYLTITNKNDDGITIYTAEHIWIDHISFYDCQDGSCDISNGSDWVTVSNCKFTYPTQKVHNFAQITGSATKDDGSKIHVTLHHNWYGPGCQSRMPSGSYSNVHVYNNYFSCSGNNYCTNARVGTKWLVENNYYDGVNNPCYYEGGGIMKISGQIYNNCKGKQETTSNGSVSVPYTYSLTPTSSLPSFVQANAGNISRVPVNTMSASLVNSEIKYKTELNPVNDHLKITLGNEFADGATIQLFDNSGRMIIRLKATGMETSIGMESLPSGLYLVKVSNAGQSAVKQIEKVSR